MSRMFVGCNSLKKKNIITEDEKILKEFTNHLDNINGCKII